MSLVNWNEAEKADLEAEDQAIRDADKPKTEEPATPVGTALQRLIDEAVNGATPPLHATAES